MRKLHHLLVPILLFLSSFILAESQLIFELNPDTKQNASLELRKIIHQLSERTDSSRITLKFAPGRYDFFENGAFDREYYISNHDQSNPKKVAFALEDLHNVTIEGQGSEFVFHGRMIPFSIINGKGIVLKNFSVDFELPAFRQLHILSVDSSRNELTAELYPKGNYRIEDNRLIFKGEGWEIVPNHYMAFRADKRLTFLRRDLQFNPKSIEEISADIIKLIGFNDSRYASPGEVFALRTYYRPTPGIFISHSKNTQIYNVKVHYAEGMGLLAQMSENITLDGFSVSLKGDDDPRYFTTQADATHFSACKGVIISKNGLYEGMADDAINVHGTYLLVSKRVNHNTVHAKYMHPQTWGFQWGEQGDSVQFVEANKMELIGNHINYVRSIRAIDQTTDFGAKEFEIVFENSLPAQISENDKFGIENLSWTPEVIFSNNIIRNNRARGALFSTPRSVICENNLFDHTHGTAILLCGDCNGWFETGACKDVIIRNNVFVNALTANYQFTNAIISIYPEIPNLKDQEKYFHSGIVIENNIFKTFDTPILYAKSTDGLIFRNNQIQKTNDFEPFHWNKHRFFLERVRNFVIENNDFEDGFNAEVDIRIN